MANCRRLTLDSVNTGIGLQGIQRADRASIIADNPVTMVASHVPGVRPYQLGSYTTHN